MEKKKINIFVKCTVIHSLALPTLIYTGSILEYSDDEFIKKINRFIWNITDRIKCNTIIGHINDRGLGITDVESKTKL